MTALGKQPGVAALALRFAILTATRTGEVIGGTWGEVDLGAALWTIPAERMKAQREHRVPLSAPALAILREMLALRTSDDDALPIFPGRNPGRPVEHGAYDDAAADEARRFTVHGFRSTFRDWAGEAMRHPREVAEAALAHVVGDKTEAAYLRADFIAKRRKLMDDWAAFCGRTSRKGENVLALADVQGRVAQHRADDQPRYERNGSHTDAATQTNVIRQDRASHSPTR